MDEIKKILLFPFSFRDQFNRLFCAFLLQHKMKFNSKTTLTFNIKKKEVTRPIQRTKPFRVYGTYIYTPMHCTFIENWQFQITLLRVEF